MNAFLPAITRFEAARRGIPRLSEEATAFLRVFFSFELCIPTFALAWPFAVKALTGPLLNHRRGCTGDDSAFFLTMLMGLPIGIHVALLFVQRTLWLKSRAARACFLLLSAACAGYITYGDSAGGLEVLKSSIDRATYFLAAQTIPLLWFVYNLHGETWLKALARRRSEKIKRVAVANSIVVMSR